MPISIWAMNFALMFALALGIDYALFVVHRFRGALLRPRLSAVDATAVTMDTAGKAVLFSGITVLISLTAVMLVPSPAFRSMSLGIMLAVIFVLAATLTLLPAVLARLGPKGGQAVAAVGALRRAPLTALRALGRAPVAPTDPPRRRRAGDPGRTGAPGHAAEDRDAVDQGRPDLRRLPDRLQAGAGRLRTRRHRAAADRHADRRKPRRRRSSPAGTPASPP